MQRVYYMILITIVIIAFSLSCQSQRHRKLVDICDGMYEEEIRLSAISLKMMWQCDMLLTKTMYKHWLIDEFAGDQIGKKIGKRFHAKRV